MHAKVSQRHAKQSRRGQPGTLHDQVRQGIDRHGAHKQERGLQPFLHVVASEGEADGVGGANTECGGDGQGKADARHQVGGKHVVAPGLDQHLQDDGGENGADRVV